MKFIYVSNFEFVKNYYGALLKTFPDSGMIVNLFISVIWLLVYYRDQVLCYTGKNEVQILKLRT